jgi:hypothetical protein
MQSVLKRFTLIMAHLCVKRPHREKSKSLSIQDINRFFSGEFGVVRANGIRVAYAESGV